MTRFIIILLLLVACEEKQQSSSLFLSNMGQPTEVTFRVFVDEELLLTDTVINEHISFHWSDFKVDLPRESFKLGIEVTAENFIVRKDTVLERSSDSLFITYDFHKYHKRYNNPEIITHMKDGVEVNAQLFADSLYANGLLSNASEYLNDTLPSSKNIEIINN